MINLPLGKSDFAKIVKENQTFVDKSLFARDLIRDGAGVILITRPRRFGKTMAMSMLECFFGLDQEPTLFNNLQIAQDADFCSEHQNNYPVIFISFSTLKYKSFERSLDGLKLLASTLFDKYKFLLDGDLLSDLEKSTFNSLLLGTASLNQLESCLEELCKYLERKYQRPPILLIDEYDTPIQNAYLEGYYEQMMPLMRGILGQALKDNRYLKKALLTGISKVSQESLFSGLNNIRVYTMLDDRYAQYFGFTEAEVSKLIDITGNFVDLQQVKQWYNGYQIGETTIYNPWSIINCLDNNGQLRPYWINTADHSILEKLVSTSSIRVKYDLERLLEDHQTTVTLDYNLVFNNLFHDDSAFWTFLFYTGYLKVVSNKVTKIGNIEAVVNIPNYETESIYLKTIYNWFNGPQVRPLQDFCKILMSGNTELFAQEIENYLKQSGSYFDFHSKTPEQVYQALILGLVANYRDDYLVESNREVGFGRHDIAFIPRAKDGDCIILEFKTAQTPDELSDKANEALLQITQNHYHSLAARHRLPRTLAIGLAFCGKHVAAAGVYVNSNATH